MSIAGHTYVNKRGEKMVFTNIKTEYFTDSYISEILNTIVID